MWFISVTVFIKIWNSKTTLTVLKKKLIKMNMNKNSKIPVINIKIITEKSQILLVQWFNEKPSAYYNSSSSSSSHQ